MIVTLSANFVRYIASSTAESPPPITTISHSSKKAPSHVAQYETPLPQCSFSPLQPSSLALAPVATTTAKHSYFTPSLPCTMRVGELGTSSIFSALALLNSTPNFSACFLKASVRAGPEDSGKPG